MTSGKWPIRDALFISYLAHFDSNLVHSFDTFLKDLSSEFKPESRRVLDLIDRINNKCNELSLCSYPEFINAAMIAISAVQCGIHFLLEGKSGSGLSTLACFIDQFQFQGNSSTFSSNTILLCSDYTLDDILGSFKPHCSKENEEATELIKWGNGPVLSAVINVRCLVLDRINEGMMQVVERLNPLLEKNAKDQTEQNILRFTVPEKGNDDEIAINSGFFALATFTTNSSSNKNGLSSALQSRFTSICVQQPEMTEIFIKSFAYKSIEL
jgi:hypothetical protein